MKLSLGFSPCPNDCFIVDALIHNRIADQSIRFDTIIEDVERLNERALKGELDFTKMSFHAFLYCRDQYQLLNAGAAIGFGVGPILVASDNPGEMEILKGPIALPGKLTTANLLFSLRYPDCESKIFMPFDQIEHAVIAGKVRGGVVIHEGRFTYREKGLRLVLDLGTYWEKETGGPIPLGAFFARKSLGAQVIQQVDALLKSSIAFAFSDPGASSEFVALHAQEMDESIRQKHINLYVNAYALDLGDAGRNAVERLLLLSEERIMP